MNPIEDELRRALQREDPPANFAGRVLERVRPPSQRRWRRWMALAASLAMLGDFGYQQWHYRRALEAKQQLMGGLRIAGSELRNIRKNFISTEETQ